MLSWILDVSLQTKVFKIFCFSRINCYTCFIENQLTRSYCVSVAEIHGHIVTNVLSHPYHLDESIFILRGIGGHILFSMKIM